jgi:hypothetical protein
MAGFKGFSQNRGVTARERRNAALLAQAMDLIFTGALDIEGDGEIVLTLASPSGLSQTGDALTVVGGDGIAITASGVEVDLATTPGLEFSAGELQVLDGDGITVTASGVEINLAATSGLEFTGGALNVNDGDGITVTASGVEVDLATNPGLEFDTGSLRVKVNPDGTLVRDANGIGVDFDAAAPTTTKGDLIAHDGTDNVRVAVGSGRQILVPDTSASAGVAWEDRFSGCQVYVDNSGSGFDVSDATTTAIEWDAENFDTDSYHDNVTNNTRITVPEAGKYRISLTFVWDVNPWPTGGRVLYQYRVNGVTASSMWIEDLYETVNPARSFSVIADLSASDYIEILVRHGTGATRTLFSDVTVCTVERID